MLAATPARAEFQEDYALGLKAVDDGRYDEARKYLERALAAQSTPVDKVILNGDVEQPYLPYHFLGIIAWKLGDCDTAKAQWGNATHRRMIGRLNQIRQQEQRLAETCKPKAASAAVHAAAAPPVAEAAPPPPPPEKTAEPVSAKAAAPGRPALTGGERTPAKLKDGDTTPAAEKSEQAAPAERAPPPRLVRAVEAYLSGRYAEAARVEPESFATPRARFHAFVVRAAARYTLAELGDRADLAGARADAASAYRIDAQAQPDAVAFSPRFREFYAHAH